MTEKPASPRTVDGLLVASQEVWAVVARPGEDTLGLLRGDAEEGFAEPLRICRAVLPDGMLLIGEADPDQDQFLSDLLHGDEWGRT
ncbi:MAG: hypothetical protein ACYTDX_10250 [Planctomycetota bacterium]